MDREELIAKATRISELRKEISRLSALQKELRALEACLDTVSDGTPNAAKRRGRGEDNMEERIFAFVESHADRDWGADEIASELSIKVASARAAISKLRGASRIIDTSRGRIRAKAQEATAKEEDAIKAA